MNKVDPIKSLAACGGMLLLILDSKTALAGARDALTLITQTVIPSLFPFFFLSVYLAGTAVGKSFLILRPVALFCGLPKEREALLIPAFLGGYPAGAQAVATSWRCGDLSKEEAERMLCFSSNAGPSFLFGILSAMFPEKRTVWALWGIHILGALAAAQAVQPGAAKQAMPRKKAVTAYDALSGALRVMGNVCGWLLLFRVVIAILERWILWLLPVPVQVLTAGILELTNGCCDLTRISDEGFRFILCSAMLSFGGLCVLLQTQSVTRGLSLKWYFTGKLIQTAFSVALSWMFVYQRTLCVPLICLVFLLPRLKNQNNSSVPRTSGV